MRNSAELCSETLAMIENHGDVQSNEYVSAAVKLQPPYPASGDAEDLPQRTDALVRGLRLVLHHHGASTTVLGELQKQFHRYLDSSKDETVWLKRAKHALAYPLAKYLRNEPPASPDEIFYPAGPLRAWMRQRLTCFNRKNTHLWYSWFQAKRSTLPASDSIVQQTYETHYETLSKEDSGQDSTIEQIFRDDTFRYVIDRVRKDVNGFLRRSEAFESMSASSSASFEKTRSRGGQLGELRIRAGMKSSFGSTDLYSMNFQTRLYGRVTRCNITTETRVPCGEDDWGNLVALAGERDYISPTKCTIQAVLEPMKVRVISKGEALPYYTCRPLQRAMHSVMRGMDCFRLIGRPFCPTDMMDLKLLASPDDEWFSVDYSAATDGLSWKYSGRIFEEIIRDLPEDQRQSALSVLGPHSLYYPDENGRPVYRGLQRNGQLMGSVLSFPILCLANLGVYLLTTQGVQLGWTHYERLRHVLINGDDMVYAAPDFLWEEHIRIGERVGLKMSVGKAYHHKIYANVNSTSIHYDLSRNDVTPWQINYLNTGLFFGQHKVQERIDPREPRKDRVETGDVCEDGGDRDEEDRLYCRVASDGQLRRSLAKAHLGADPANGLVANLNTLLGGTLPGKQSEVLKMFLAEHKEDLRRECAYAIRQNGRLTIRTRNLFLPISVGGCGVTPPVDWKFKITISDRCLGGYYRDRITAPRTTCRPLPGFDLVDFKKDREVPWIKTELEPDDIDGYFLRGSYRPSRKSLVLGTVHYATYPSARVAK